MAEDSYRMLSQHSKVVFAANDAVTPLSVEDIEFLKRIADSSPQKKARILMHADPSRSLHEMLIVHTRGSYIQPHINADSAKSFLVLSGEMVVFLFDDVGSIKECHRMCANSGSGIFMLRLEEPVYHTLVVLTNTVVFLETVLGPHQQTRYGSFSPKPTEKGAVQEYMTWLERQAGIAKP